MENPPAPTTAMLEEIWRILHKVAQEQEELSEQSKETKRSLQELSEQSIKTKQSLEEGAQRHKEIDRLLKESARRHEEIDRQLKENAQQQKKTDAFFNSQWGKLMEALVDGDLVPLLQARDIAVERTLTNVRRRSARVNWEFDILAVNGEEVVVVEVKTTLRVADVRYFVEKMEQLARWMPEYRDKRVYGAVVYLKVDQGADTYALRQGLYVIRATGSSASITNLEVTT